jgi:TrmH family RNA methyltransferase
MITLKKLASLGVGTKTRKGIRLLEGAMGSLRQGKTIDFHYYEHVLLLLSSTEDQRVAEVTRSECTRLAGQFSISVSPENLIWDLANTIHLLHNDLGIDMADWDFYESEEESLDSTHRTIYPMTVVLDHIRSPFNVGSIFRTSDSFGVDRILLVSPSASPEHPRSLRTARGCTKTVPWQTYAQEQVVDSLRGKKVFAMELGGTALADFAFPEEGVMIVGSEELGTSPELLSIADSSLGRVSIPLAGSKGSLNVSVAFGIVLQSWYSHVAQRY